MKRIVRPGIAILLLSVLVAVACSPSPGEEKVSSSIEVTDQLGRVVRLDAVPQRIVSLAPSNTEILFALGLADRVVAVTDYCDYPPEAKEKPSIGGFITPNLEELIALSPDLIVAASIHEAKIIPQLEGRGLAVFVLAPKTVDDVLEAITLVGEITGNEAEATGLVAGMQGRIKAVTDKTDSLPEGQRPRVFYLVWHDPLMTAGSGTFQDDLIGKAGGTNIARDLTGWVDISLETVLAADPEVMIAGIGHGKVKDPIFQFLKTEPRLDDTDARRNDRVYGVDGDLVSRPGPRIVDGLEKLAQFIHPELFGETR